MKVRPWRLAVSRLAALVSGHGELAQGWPRVYRKQHIAAILLCGGEGERISNPKA